MTIHVEYDHNCPDCGAEYIPFEKGLACPKCGNAEEEWFDFIPQACGSMQFNKLGFGMYRPPAWFVGSLGDKTLGLLFDLFDEYENKGEGADFGEFLEECFEVMEFEDNHKYLQPYIRKLAMRVFAGLQREREEEKASLVAPSNKSLNDGESVAEASTIDTERQSVSIHLQCHSCKKNFTAPLEFVGRTGKCPKCGARLTVPAVPDKPESALEQPSAPRKVEKDESTEKAHKEQKKFAKRLGIDFGDDIGKWELSDLITTVLLEKQKHYEESEHARESVGVDVDNFMIQLGDSGHTGVLCRWGEKEGDFAMHYTADMDEDMAERSLISIVITLFSRLRGTPGYNQLIDQFIKDLRGIR